MVSIVVAFFNASESLERTISSIDAQTYTNYEVILVDDCSTDNSSGIASKKSNISPKYFYVRLPINKGAGAARQAGLNLARGEYIAFLDADDEWHCTKLDKQIAVLESIRDTIIVHTGYNVKNIHGQTIGRVMPPSTITIRHMYLSNFIATSTAVFRRSLAGADKMPVIRARQDYAFWLKLIKSNKGKVIGVREILCNYYKTPNSVSSSPIRNVKNNYLMFRGELGYSFLRSICHVASNMAYRLVKLVSLKFYNYH